MLPPKGIRGNRECDSKSILGISVALYLCLCLISMPCLPSQRSVISRIALRSPFSNSLQQLRGVILRHVHLHELQGILSTSILENVYTRTWIFLAVAKSLFTSKASNSAWVLISWMPTSPSLAPSTLGMSLYFHSPISLYPAFMPWMKRSIVYPSFSIKKIVIRSLWRIIVLTSWAVSWKDPGSSISSET